MSRNSKQLNLHFLSEKSPARKYTEKHIGFIYEGMQDTWYICQFDQFIEEFVPSKRLKQCMCVFTPIFSQGQTEGQANALANLERHQVTLCPCSKCTVVLHAGNVKAK